MKRLNIFITILPLIFGLLVACGSGGGGGSDTDPPSDLPQDIEPRAITLNDELIRPWGLAFLPDRRMLVSEKGGTMVILSADGITIQEEVSGLPEICAAEEANFCMIRSGSDLFASVSDQRTPGISNCVA